MHVFYKCMDCKAQFKGTHEEKADEKWPCFTEEKPMSLYLQLQAIVFTGTD